MACTITALEDITDFGQGEHFYLISVAFDSGYLNGGEPLDLASNRNLKRVMLQSTGGYVFSWDQANQAIKVYRQKDPGNAGGADIPLPEVANGVDLSALTDVQGIAIGPSGALCGRPLHSARRVRPQVAASRRRRIRCRVG